MKIYVALLVSTIRSPWIMSDEQRQSQGCSSTTANFGGTIGATLQSRNCIRGSEIDIHVKPEARRAVMDEWAKQLTGR